MLGFLVHALVSSFCLKTQDVSSLILLLVRQDSSTPINV